MSLYMSSVFISTSKEFYVDSLAGVFHCFAEDGVVHEFVEVFFKGRLCFLSEVCVEADVWFHPGLLIEFKHPVHLREFHTLAHVKLEFSVVNYILFFVHEVLHKLGAV